MNVKINGKVETFQAPCAECGGKCCEYVAIEIDKPTSKSDYDNVRWYLAHKDVNVFIDHDKNWYIEFRSDCLEKDENNLCKIYKTRPKICREHGNVDGECEFYDNPYLDYFTTRKEFEVYLEKKGVDWMFKKYT